LKRVYQKLLVAAMLSGACHACSLAPGYFHQVTVIRGRVVGKSLGPFGFGWLRQAFRVSDATLTIYEYRSARIEELRKVASVKTDDHGSFDFGLIPKGHYFLSITVKDSDRLGGLFDVEVTDSVKATKSITIDVSPIHPDCKGGHEFIETKS
jgi:hypothetical protein